MLVADKFENVEFKEKFLVDAKAMLLQRDNNESDAETDSHFNAHASL